MDPVFICTWTFGPVGFLVQQTQSNQTVQDFQTRMRQCENTHLCVPLYSIDRLRLAQLLDFVYFIFIGCSGGGEGSDGDTDDGDNGACDYKCSHN